MSNIATSAAARLAAGYSPGTVIGQAIVRIVTDLTGHQAGLKQAETQLDAFLASATRTAKLITLGTGIAVVGGLALATNAAAQFEQEFANVRKTVDASEATLDKIALSFRKLATEIPVSAIELSKVGAAAGQLGIQSDAIVGFTEVMARMGVTTNLSAEQAANSMARFANIMQTPQDEFDRLGSAIVDLGNKFPAFEDEIINMGLRLAGAGNILKMSEGQVLGLATALSSVGVRAEMGGSALERVMLKMNSAVVGNTDQLKTWAATAGMSVDEFVTLFRDDAAEAIIAFVGGITKIVDAGGDVTAVLGELGLNEIRARNSIIRLAGGHEILADAIHIGNDAQIENVALMEESEKKWDTTLSKLGILKNVINEAFIELGNNLLPALASFAGWLAEEIPVAIDYLKEHLGPVFSGVADIFINYVNPSLAEFTDFLGRHPELLENIAISLGIVTAGVIAFGVAMLAATLANPFTALYVAAVALGAIIVWLVRNWQDLRDEYTLVNDLSLASVVIFETVADVLQKLGDAIDKVNEYLEDHEKAAKAAEIAIAALVMVFFPLIAIVGTVITRYDQLRSALIKAFDGVSEAWGDEANKGLDILRWWWETIGEEALSFEVDVYQWMFKVGQQFIEGFSSGIDDAWDSAKPHLKDIALGAVSIFTGVWLISSPSRVMREVGMNFAAGLAQGIDDGTAQIEAELNGILATTDNFLNRFKAMIAGAFSQAQTDLSFFQLESPWVAAGFDSQNAWMDTNPAPSEGLPDGYGDNTDTGGGGGGSAAVTQITSDMLRDAFAHVDAESIMGELGTNLVNALNDSIASGDNLESVVDAANALGDAFAEEFGPERAAEVMNQVMDALVLVIDERTPEAEEALRTLLGTLNAELEAGLPFTVENFAKQFAAISEDKRLLDQFGSTGKNLWDALNTGLEEGGKASLTSMAEYAYEIRDALVQGLPEGQAAYVGSKFMEALNAAIQSGSEESLANFSYWLTTVNTVIEGGAIDIRDGTVVIAEDVKTMADALGVDTQFIIDNIGAIIDAGILSNIDKLDKLPERVKDIIAEIIKQIENGKSAVDGIMNIGTAIGGGRSTTSEPTYIGQYMFSNGMQLPVYEQGGSYYYQADDGAHYSIGYGQQGAGGSYQTVEETVADLIDRGIIQPVGESATVPSFDSGIRNVPYDMLAMIHQNEAVLSPLEASDWRSGSSGFNWSGNLIVNPSPGMNEEELANMVIDTMNEEFEFQLGYGSVQWGTRR